LHSNDLVYQLGIDALANGNEENGAGKAEAYGQDSDQRPPPIAPNAPPGQSNYHGSSPLLVKALFVANLVLTVAYISKS